MPSKSLSHLAADAIAHADEENPDAVLRFHGAIIAESGLGVQQEPARYRQRTLRCSLDTTLSDPLEPRMARFKMVDFLASSMRGRGLAASPEQVSRLVTAPVDKAKQRAGHQRGIDF